MGMRFTTNHEIILMNKLFLINSYSTIPLQIWTKEVTRELTPLSYPNFFLKISIIRGIKMAEAATTKASTLVGKLETDVEIKASAGKFHHMFAGRPHHVSKASPGKIKACDLHEGDWGKVGSIVYWNYVHGKYT